MLWKILIMKSKHSLSTGNLSINKITLIFLMFESWFQKCFSISILEQLMFIIILYYYLIIIIVKNPAERFNNIIFSFRIFMRFR